MLFIAPSASTNSSRPWPDLRTGCIPGWILTNTSVSAIRRNWPKILGPLIATYPASILQGRKIPPWLPKSRVQLLWLNPVVRPDPALKCYPFAGVCEGQVVDLGQQDKTTWPTAVPCYLWAWRDALSAQAFGSSGEGPNWAQTYWEGLMASAELLWKMPAGNLSVAVQIFFIASRFSFYSCLNYSFSQTKMCGLMARGWGGYLENMGPVHPQMSPFPRGGGCW